MDLSGHILKKVPRKYGEWVESMSKDLVHVSNIASFNSILLNPATGTKYCFSDWKGEGASYLFGQSASKGEHKVLRRFDNSTIGHIHQLIEVFTLNNSGYPMWREKQAPSQRLASDKWTDVVIDGVAYILSWNAAFYELRFSRRVNRKDMIITFDLETEEWGTILGPNIIFQVLRGLGSSLKPRRLTLADLNGSLAVVCLYEHVPSMDIWISMDIARGDWVKKYNIRFEQYDKLSYVHPVFILDDQRLVIYIEDKELLQIYNPRTKTFTNDVELEHCSSICLYTGNLLSLEC